MPDFKISEKKVTPGVAKAASQPVGVNNVSMDGQIVLLKRGLKQLTYECAAKHPTTVEKMIQLAYVHDGRVEVCEACVTIRNVVTCQTDVLGFTNDATVRSMYSSAC